ncbi:MAG: glycosyltransferase [Bacilli bacterium]|nr:glycosyltransferase [Bacilli bacterium]MDD4282576.1 glycosyltransferase [Bacilli bacterium]MDD4718797.1 glycosyltransferase [Bacilli bacterium]
MRIGIFTDTYPPFINGVSTSILVLQKALEKKGHEVFIITVNNEKIGYNFSNDKIIRIPGIPVGIYDYRLTSIYPIRIINKIKNLNLDVIHSQTEFGVGTFARILSKQFDIPLVHTYHTMYEDYVSSVAKGYFKWPRNKIIEELTKFYCDRTASELIVPTQKTYDLFKEKYKVDRKVHIVPSGIEIEKYFHENYKIEDIVKLKKEFEFSEDDFIILFVGRLGQEKNVDFLIDSHSLLAKRNDKCKLLIIGDGPLMNKYKKKIKRLRLTSSVILGGKVPYEEIGKYYQLASVFATASSAETQGLTVIEALAASVPIIVIDDESYDTAISHNENGFKFKNKREYRKHINHLMNNPEVLKKMKMNARNSSLKHSSEYFANEVLKVYKIAIGDRTIKESKTFFSRFKKVVKNSWKMKK